MIGHFPNLSNEEYHSYPGTSKTQLDKIHISPLEYWDCYKNPNVRPRSEEDHFLFGTGAHSIILEPDVFKEHYAVGFDKSKYPDALDTIEDLNPELIKRNLSLTGTKRKLVESLISDGYPKEKIMLCQQEEYASSCQNKKIIPSSDYKDMLGMLDAVNSHHTASKLLKGCAAEHSYLVEDEYGMIRKCRPDFITANGRVVCDLKSTTDVSPSGFGRSIVKYRYLIQAAWYLDVLKLHYGDDAPTVFSFIAIQKTRPYDVAVYYATEDQIAIGRAAYQQDYDLLRACLESDNWPGCDGGRMLEIELPKWA